MEFLTSVTLFELVEIIEKYYRSRFIQKNAGVAVETMNFNFSPWSSNDFGKKSLYEPEKFTSKKLKCSSCVLQTGDPSML